MAQKFSQAEFNQFIQEHKVIGFFDKPITLKSGRQSFWYVNWRNVVEDVFLTDKLTEFVLSFTQDLLSSRKITSKPECFYGVPEGATKLGILTQYKWAKLQSNFSQGSHVLCMGRGKPKEHGVAKDKFFVGSPRGSTILLEDVTTTGGSLISSIDHMLESDIPIIAAIGLTNRMEKRDDGKSVEQALELKHSSGNAIKYFYMSSALELLPLAIKQLNPSKEVVKHIIHEFEQYGVETLML